MSTSGALVNYRGIPSEDGGGALLIVALIAFIVFIGLLIKKRKPGDAVAEVTGIGWIVTFLFGIGLYALTAAAIPAFIIFGICKAMFGPENFILPGAVGSILAYAAIWRWLSKD